MSPFTLAITRSTISARVKAAAAARLTDSSRSFDGFMIHLGPGHDGPDELADRAVRFPPLERRLHPRPAFVQHGRARRPALVHPQHVVPVRRGHDLARGA